MRRFYDHFSVNQLFQPMTFAMLALFFIMLASASGTAFAQNTAELCRETEKVLDQYQRETDTLESKLFVVKRLNEYIDTLSNLDKAIRGGYVVTGLSTLREDTNRFTYSINGSTFEHITVPRNFKEQLAIQRQIYPLLKRVVDEAATDDKEELLDQIDRIEAQIKIRGKRLADLKCNEVLARESTATAAVNTLGTWSGTYENSKKKKGSSTISFTKGAAGKITGNEDGALIEDVTISGNVISWEYKAGSCRTFKGSLTINPDGKTASGSYTASGCDDPYSGSYIDYKKQ